MPNTFAYLALLLTAALAAVAFALLKPRAATAVVLIGAVLFLPQRVEFDTVGLPAFDKLMISGLCALVGALITAPRSLMLARPGRGVDALGILAVAAAVGTVFTNRERLVYSTTVLPAHVPSDVLSILAPLILTVFVPFLLGRALFRTSADLRTLLRVLVLLGIIYLPLVAYEVRMSPQLHRIVYGFTQHSFSQTYRGGGWRPMVFMAHGLALGLFVMTAMVAAWAALRARVNLRFLPTSMVVFALTLLLVLVKSLGALLYGLAAIPLVLFGRAKLQVRVAALLGAITLGYPMLRSADMFPVEATLDLARELSTDRAESLAFRFYHEDHLLEKALERPWFGWGNYARGRVYDEEGRDISVTDGAWIIVLGSRGALGFVALFGLLLFPIWKAAWVMRKIPRRSDRLLLAGLALIVALRCVDLLPNGLFSHITIFLAGALHGLATGIPREHQRDAPARAHTLIRGKARG